VKSPIKLQVLLLVVTCMFIAHFNCDTSGLGDFHSSKC